MSVNTGGFFFSNPTPAHLPPTAGDGDDENMSGFASGGSLGGCGTAMGNSGLASGMGAGPTGAMPNNMNMPSNFNPSAMSCGNQQMAVANNMNMQTNFNLPNQGNSFMNGNRTSNNALNVMGNPVNNMGMNMNNSNMGNPMNNMGMTMNNNMGNPSTINQNNMANSNSGGNNGQGTNNSNFGFGNFFFNPLALFSGNSNNNNAPNNMNANTMMNSQSFGGNVTNVLPGNNMNMNTNTMMMSNTSGSNTMMNGNNAGMCQNNQPPMHMAQDSLNQATSQTLPMNNQFAMPPGAPSPIPMAFMTPKQGPSPCPTPPTPMFHDANANTPPPNFANVSYDNFNSNVTMSPGSGQIVTEGTDNVMVQEEPAAATKGGIFSIMGSALGTVASYVNQSFLSGIPFHIADRAMKESKATYAKWWEGGINGKRKVEGDADEDDAGDIDGHTDKKQRLNSGRAVGVGTGGGSSLSKSLKKNYDDMGIDTSCKYVEYQQQKQPQECEPLPYEQDVQGVDYSIIKPRRRRTQFDQSKKKPEASVSGNEGELAYNAFNNIGGMYDFGDAGGGEEQQDIGTPAHEGEGIIHQTAMSYDSLGGYYATNDDVEDAASRAATPLEPEKVNATTTTITSNPTPLDGTLNAIHEILEEKNRASDENELVQMIRSPRDWVKKSIRSELIDALQSVQGDVKDKRFLASLSILSNFYKTSGRDARVSPWCGRRSVEDPGVEGGSYGYSGSEVGGPTASDLLEGNWVNMSRPNYVECLGHNAENDFMYTLGRMSFDMFQPGGLICSVQSTHNTIRIIGEREELPAFVPKSLREEVASLCDSASARDSSNRPLLRSYDIAVSLTIEPPSSVGQPEPPASTPTPKKRMRAIMSVKGYVLPDPTTPNRLTVWFTGGKLSPARLASNADGECETDDEDHAAQDKPAGHGKVYADDSEDYGGFEDWSDVFSKGKWRKSLGERARAMAAKLLLGADVPNKMEEDGHMEYMLHRPVGGHSKVYVDVLYLDEDILIMRGHHGTIYAMARSGVSQRYRALSVGEDTPE